MKHILSSLLLLSAVLVPLSAANASRVDILPRKIVMDDRQRSADITIMNLGNKTGTIRLSIISYRQDEKGNYEMLETPLNPAFDPATMVRFSPKQFTLPPNGRQKIRLTVQRPADLPDGEYRFHIKAISYETVEAMAGKPIPSKGNSLALQMNIAVAIPVIVRKGDLTSTAKMENITFLSPSQTQHKQSALQLDVVRTGTAGVLGTITAYWEAAGGGAPVEIGTGSNVNAFSEVAKRQVIVPLTQEITGSGKIRVRYTNDFGDKGVFDEVVLDK